MNNIVKSYIKVVDGYKFSNKYLNNNSEKSAFKEPIGLYDPLGLNINPLTNAPYENFYENDKPIEIKEGPLAGEKVSRSYLNLAYLWTNLHVYKYLNEILESVQKNQVTIIRAGTGVGKTVIVPKIALQAFNFKKRVVCTVPKQVIAFTNAEFSAQCLAVKLGQEVGYFYMGKKELSGRTKLVFTTPGSLKSQITGSDPYLEEYDCVIIDEIHERSIQTDQLLLMMKTILHKRPEFRLILMSATIDLSEFKSYFTVKSKFSYNEIDVLGTSFDVKLYYEPKPLTDWRTEAINKILYILNNSDSGDILVFIKSGGDGNFLCEELKKKTRNSKNINPFCVILEAKTQKAQRNMALSEFGYLSDPEMDPNHPYTRKIVMATNVAESSLTVDGVKYVIDNGYALVSAFFPKTAANSLLEERISQAAAQQRKGRAGRTTSGFCYRLYTEKEFDAFPKFPVPDIQKTDITSDILDIFLLEYIQSVADVRIFLNNLLSPPGEDFIFCSLSKLYALGAIDNIDDSGKITEMGKALAQFRIIEPNLAKSILAGYYYHCKREIINIILISLEIDGRMDVLFEKYYQRNKKMSLKDAEAQKTEHARKQQQFYSPYGDYFTILNVYEALSRYMRDTDAMSVNNSLNEENMGNASNTKVSNSSKKSVSAVKFWCKENGISSRVFLNKRGSKHWDKIKEQSRKLNRLVMDIIRPLELRQKYFKEYKNDGGKENLRTIRNKIKNNSKMIIDPDSDDIFEIGGPVSKADDSELIVQTGGFETKPYEINLFPEANFTNMNSRDKNILMALAIGNITNMAKKVNAQKGLYKSCFPQEKIVVGIDRNSSLSKKNYSEHIMYNEIFMIQKNMLKLNLVTKMPNEIVLKIKKNYGQFIKTCFEKNISPIKNIRKGKKVMKSKKGVKGVKGVKGIKGKKGVKSKI